MGGDAASLVRTEQVCCELRVGALAVARVAVACVRRGSRRRRLLLLLWLGLLGRAFARLRLLLYFLPLFLLYLWGGPGAFAGRPTFLFLFPFPFLVF